MTTPETTDGATPEITPKATRRKTSATGTFLRTAAASRPEMVPQAEPAPKVKTKPKVVRVNFYLPPEMADAIRDAVYHIGRGHTLGTTMADFVPGILAELEEKYNDGKPFPHRPPSAKNLTTGPPVRLDRQDGA